VHDSLFMVDAHAMTPANEFAQNDDSFIHLSCHKISRLSVSSRAVGDSVVVTQPISNT